jgi:hemerythrin
MPIKWEKRLNTGIDVIDSQHKRIVEYINELEVAHKRNDIPAVGRVLDECVDYTQSHFAFEESLQEDAGYIYRKQHKKVHELFVKRIAEYQKRFHANEDITEELYDTLSRWLINHIEKDDADYVGAVKESMIDIIGKKKKKTGWLKRFFK